MRFVALGRVFEYLVICFRLKTTSPLVHSSCIASGELGTLSRDTLACLPQQLADLATRQRVTPRAIGTAEGRQHLIGIDHHGEEFSLVPAQD